ncbi:MAG: hypothetical protein J5J00_07330 [Deltaproteobacteria bacterium]|nr:hypothetical protein [Deltaproteobacteria bacterium]
MPVAVPSHSAIEHTSLDTGISTESQKEAPLSSALTSQEIALISGSKILIVDDFSFDLERTERLLAPLKEYGCTIDRCDNPEKALEKLNSAALAGTPYTILVSDICMTSYERNRSSAGFNGDALLRRHADLLSQHDISMLPATVYFTGSWARPEQAKLLNALEFSRRHSAGEEALPITIVEKHANPEDLIPAILYALKASSAPQRAMQFIKNSLELPVFERDFDSFALSREWGLLKAMQENALNFISACKEGGLESAKNVQDLERDTGYIASKYPHFEVIIGSDFEARNCRHNLPSAAGMLFHGTLDFDTDAFPRNFRPVVSEYRESQQAMWLQYKLAYALRESSPAETFNVADAFDRYLSIRENHHSSLTSPVQLSGRERVFSVIVEQLVQNAQKFTSSDYMRGRDPGVNVSFDTLSKGEAPVDVVDELSRKYKRCSETLFSVTVSDNGCGIAPEDLPKIFEAGFSRSRSTGQGLAMVAEFIREHEGVIRVESVLGEGTTFRLFFNTTASN